VKRVVFNEITEKAVLEAVENPIDLNYNLVGAQQARQILDKMIGYRLSNFTRKKVQARSAGRVKSAVLKLILEREEEIKNFKPEY
jgi:DNA topoisomerase-1